jgi:hypothetical protein
MPLDSTTSRQRWHLPVSRPLLRCVSCSERTSGSRAIAQNVGIPKDSLNRASAGIDHVLLEATTEGHCALPVVQLTASAVKLLEVGAGTVEQALSQMILHK